MCTDFSDFLGRLQPSKTTILLCKNCRTVFPNYWARQFFKKTSSSSTVVLTALVAQEARVSVVRVALVMPVALVVVALVILVVRVRAVVVLVVLVLEGLVLVVLNS